MADNYGSMHLERALELSGQSRESILRAASCRDHGGTDMNRRLDISTALEMSPIEGLGALVPQYYGHFKFPPPNSRLSSALRHGH